MEGLDNQTSNYFCVNVIILDKDNMSCPIIILDKILPPKILNFWQVFLEIFSWIYREVRHHYGDILEKKAVTLGS